MFIYEILDRNNKTLKTFKAEDNQEAIVKAEQLVKSKNLQKTADMLCRSDAGIRWGIKKYSHSVSLSQERKDYTYLLDTYGPMQDFCGGVCNTEMFENVLLGKTSVSETLQFLITEYFRRGLDDPNCDCVCTKKMPDSSDPMVQKIRQRYNLTEN